MTTHAKKGPAKKPKADETPDGPDLADIGAELARQLTELGKEFKVAAEKVADEAQYHVDRELAKALARHPELYAEVKRTLRQVQKTVDTAAEAFGLKGK